MPKKTAKQTNPDIKVAVDAFHEAFLRKFGFKPQIHGGKDGAHFANLLATWSCADVLATIETFFATSDPRVVRSDYTVGALFSLAHHVRLLGARPTDHKTASNVDAAMRAMERR